MIDFNEWRTLKISASNITSMLIYLHQKRLASQSVWMGGRVPTVSVSVHQAMLGASVSKEVTRSDCQDVPKMPTYQVSIFALAIVVSAFYPEHKYKKIWLCSFSSTFKKRDVIFQCCHITSTESWLLYSVKWEYPEACHKHCFMTWRAHTCTCTCSTQSVVSLWLSWNAVFFCWSRQERNYPCKQQKSVIFM